MHNNIEDTICKLMKEYGDGNISVIQSTLKNIDPKLIKYSLDRFVEQGKIEFKKKKYLDAINSFSQAISGYKLQIDEKKNASEKKEYEKELCKLFSNRSQCYLKIGQDENYIRAFEDAKECILLDSEWSKGWYRAGKALYFLRLYKKAIILFKAAHKRESNSKVTEESKSSIEDIEKLMKICEKRADHEMAIKRVTVDYSKFEDVLKEIEMEELKEASKELELNNKNSENIINLPKSFGGSLIGNAGDENLQLELSPDLSQEEINNLKLSLGGSPSEANKKKKKGKLSKISFDVESRFTETDTISIESESIKGISRLVQMSTEIQWFKRIIENFVDNSYTYVKFWIEYLNNEIKRLNSKNKKDILFIGSGSFILPIYVLKNSENINVTTITQTRANFSCIYRIYSNIALSNDVKLIHLNSLDSEFLKNVDEIYIKEIDNKNTDLQLENIKFNPIKLIHGHTWTISNQIWEKIVPSSIIIDPSVFEPGLFGYGLIHNIWSLYNISQDDEFSISVTPSLIEVYLYFSYINIPSINLQSDTENNNCDLNKIKFDVLNEGLWSPYWEPLKVKCSYSNIQFLSEPILLGIVPIEKMLNERNYEYFILNFDSNKDYKINKIDTIDKDCHKIHKGIINYKLQPNTCINSIILTFKANKEINDESGIKKMTLLDTSSQLFKIENESVISPAIQWIGGIISNQNHFSFNIDFKFQIESTRIIITPDIKSLKSKNSTSDHTKIENNSCNFSKIPHKFVCSLPRSVIENLWDIKSLEIWLKVLTKAYKSSINQSMNNKVFEGIVTSTSPGAILPITLLYISSKLNKSIKNNLFNTWRKADVHFTCIENLPNVQELYMKVIRDNVDIILSDVVENEVRSLYLHNEASNNPKVTQAKYWRPINELEKNNIVEYDINKENNLFKKWLLSDPSAKHILNKKLSERLTFISGDVRQIVPQASNINPNPNIQYHFINEKARIFTGMNFDHDGLSEGIIPLWATASQNGIIRKYNNKMQNNPIPFKISFYGFIAQIGHDNEFGINTSFWDTYRFEGNMQWVPIKNLNKLPLYQRTEIFHILTIELNNEGFSKLSEWKNEIATQVTKEGRINSIIIFFDLWIDNSNVLTTSPFDHKIERPDLKNARNKMDLTSNNKNKTSSFSDSIIKNDQISDKLLQDEFEKKINFCHTNLWRPTFHMIPQQSKLNKDTLEMEFTIDKTLTKLQFSIKSSSSNNGENTPSTINSDDIENNPFVFPPLGDFEFLQLRQKYNSIVKEISPMLYSEDTSISAEAFNASLNIALNPSYYLGKNAIVKEDTLYDIDSLNWLCQSFLL